MSSSASTDTFPVLPADVAATRRAVGITIAPEAALHRALQERTDELERVRADYSELRQAKDAIEAAYDRVVRERDAAHEQVATMQAGYEAALSQAVIERDAAVDEVVRLVRARDEARASITRFAEAAAAHDANADVFVDDEYHISTRALVEEFCREHGHPLAHEWATAKINAAPDGGAPTAPDVALPCAPAAGAADPPPSLARARRRSDAESSARARA